MDSPVDYRRLLQPCPYVRERERATAKCGISASPRPVPYLQCSSTRFRPAFDDIDGACEHASKRHEEGRRTLSMTSTTTRKHGRKTDVNKCLEMSKATTNAPSDTRRGVIQLRRPASRTTTRQKRENAAVGDDNKQRHAAEGEHPSWREIPRASKYTYPSATETKRDRTSPSIAHLVAGLQRQLTVDHDDNDGEEPQIRCASKSVS